MNGGHGNTFQRVRRFTTHRSNAHTTHPFAHARTQTHTSTRLHTHKAHLLAENSCGGGQWRSGSRDDVMGTAGSSTPAPTRADTPEDRRERDADCGTWCFLPNRPAIVGASTPDDVPSPFSSSSSVCALSLSLLPSSSSLTAAEIRLTTFAADGRGTDEITTVPGGGGTLSLSIPSSTASRGSASEPSTPAPCKITVDSAGEREPEL